jgi:hypothetical protein
MLCLNPMLTSGPTSSMCWALVTPCSPTPKIVLPYCGAGSHPATWPHLSLAPLCLWSKLPYCRLASRPWGNHLIPGEGHVTPCGTAPDPLTLSLESSSCVTMWSCVRDHGIRSSFQSKPAAQTPCALHDGVGGRALTLSRHGHPTAAMIE